MAPSVVATEPASITPIPLSILPHADTSLVLQIEADRIARGFIGDSPSFPQGLSPFRS